MECAVAICRLAELDRADAASFGSKGANLGALTRLGLPVPPGFAVAASACAEHAERCGLTNALRPLIEQRDWGGAERMALALMSAHPMEGALTAALSDALRCLEAEAVAVRSSAIAEDLAEASFAGQYDTFLDVRGEAEVQRAIGACWASLWSRRALEYRHRRSIDHDAGGMAVVVQTMVPADASGVLFTVDPVAQRSDRIVIEAVSGLGEDLVSGRTRDAVYRVDRARLELVDQEGMVELLPAGQMAKLCRLSLEVERHFGCPQDIEFALSGETVFLLQARPITTLGRAIAEPLEPPGRPTITDRTMKPLVSDRYVIAPRPLDNITYTRCVGAAIDGLRRIGGIVTTEDEAAFQRQVWHQAYRFPRHRLTWRVLFASWHQMRLLREDWLSWWEQGPRPALRAMSNPVDLAGLSDTALFQRADHILATWEEPLRKRMYVASAYRTEIWLRTLVTLAVGSRNSARVLAQLLGGLRHPTLDANAALWELSRRATRAPVVRSAVRGLAPGLLEQTTDGREFLQAFNGFMETYGHRDGSCWYLSTPTWRREPMQVWRLLASMMDVEEPPRGVEQASLDYRNARALVERRLRFIPGLLPPFRWLLDAIRSLTAFREHSHFDLTRPLSALQDIAAEWGHRLVERGVLRDPDEVFYLTHKEARDWILGEAPEVEEVRELVQRRRATYQLANTRWQAERSDGSVRGAALKGIATSPGVVRGRARIVRGEHQFELLRPAEVLVCSYTNPAWTPLFATAAAVVTETGGAASHAAIVAREYGIPAVMSVQDATRILADGDDILVDGDRGTVRRVRES
ncbi:MAG: PEP/pyruvate-binding domain-containing protein [Acidobacteriota bacterium]